MSYETACDEIFKAIDSDGSDSISIDEFKSYFNDFKDLVTVDGDAQAVFALIDVNGDGSLSKEELKEFIKNRLKK